MQIVPHRLVADALATFGQEEGGIGLRIGKVRADVVFIDAHGRLGEGGENRLADPFARALAALAMPRLDTIVLVKEVAMQSEGIQMENFIGAQATFRGDDDHGVVTRGRQLLLIVADVLHTDEVVELQQLFTGEDEAFLFLLEGMHWVVILQHGLLKTAVLGADRLDLGARNVGVCQDILKQAAQAPQIALHGTRLEPGIDQTFTEAHDALPSEHRGHGLPHEELALPFGAVFILQHEALEPTAQKATFGFDGAVAVIARGVSIQIALEDALVIGEHL